MQRRDTALKILAIDSTYTLAAGRLMRIEGAAGWSIVCERGHITLTQPGDARDLGLAAGDAVVLLSGGRVLVGAEGEPQRDNARFRLLQPPGTAAQLRTRLARLGRLVQRSMRAGGAR
jgi:hypothetical protein